VIKVLATLLAAMKIQVASDIHLEFFEDTDVLPRIEALGNVLALVGDIGYPKHDLFGKFIREHADRFEHVFLIGTILTALTA
jgi:hypothetical protein